MNIRNQIFTIKTHVKPLSKYLRLFTVYMTHHAPLPLLLLLLNHYHYG